MVVQYNHCPSLPQLEAYYKDTNRKMRELGELAKELGPKWDGELLKSCCEMDHAWCGKTVRYNWDSETVRTSPGGSSLGTSYLFFWWGVAKYVQVRLSKSTRKNPYRVQKIKLWDVVYQKNRFIMTVHSPMLRAMLTSKTAEVAAKSQSKKCDLLQSWTIGGVQEVY